ncbi:MAG TPA: class I SAM-dependent methyltransferase, partial [Anaerolineales bacterium]|nr:class I SAM-dependent methyltransferase [Anaerolineales bacterium]
MFPELYHAHHNRHLEDLPFWLALATQTSDPILELGCGTGRLLLPLAQAGFRCVGLDRDLGMLRYLHANLDPSLMAKPHCIAADISHFALQEQFPLIILPCNTFSTLATQQRRDCLSRVHKHLEPGGIFAVSLPNPELWRELPTPSDIEY